MAPKGRKRAAPPDEKKRPSSLTDACETVRQAMKRPRSDDKSVMTLNALSSAAHLLSLPNVTWHHRDLSKKLADMFPDVPTDKGYSVTHLCLLVWAPLLEAAATADALTNLSEELKQCEALVGKHLSIVLGMDATEPQDTDTIIDWMAGLLAEFLDTLVDSRFIKHHVTALIPFVFDPTYLTGFTLLASGRLEKCLGPTLNALVVRKAKCFLANTDLDVPPAATLQSLISEVLEQRAPREESDAPQDTPLNASRKKKLAPRWNTAVQAMVELAVKTRQAVKTLPQTLVEVQSTFVTLQQAATGEEEADSHFTEGLPIAADSSLRRHLLWIDEALELWYKEKLFQARGKSFFGAGIATDESPPSQPRFRGLRFQVTLLYVPLFPPVATWEGAVDPPITVDTMLLDVCHCHHKDGAYVSGVVQKQLARLGVSSADIVSGTGDRGGENEGFDEGLHAHFEQHQPGYVRRRCLNHIAWTVCKAGLAECEDLCVPEICAYLTRGVTWTSLQAVATQSIRNGGLALLTENGPRFKSIFHKAPGTVVEDRPESTMNFLGWLRTREPLLAQCAAKDLTQRNLGEGSKKAAAALASKVGQLRRSILAELLHKALHLARVGNLAQRLSIQTTMRDALLEATDLLTDRRCTSEVAARIGLPAARRDRTWIEAIAKAHLSSEQELTIYGARVRPVGQQLIPLHLCARQRNHPLIHPPQVTRGPHPYSTPATPPPARTS